MKRFDMGTIPPLPDPPDLIWLWGAKLSGAIAGSAISLAYVLPRGRREAAIRFLTGLMIGVIFGPAAGAMLAGRLGLETVMTRFELTLMGAASASLAAWWALGVLRRFLETRFPAIRK